MVSLSLQILSEVFLVGEVFQKKEKSGNDIKSGYYYYYEPVFIRTYSLPLLALYTSICPANRS